MRKIVFSIVFTHLFIIGLHAQQTNTVAYQLANKIAQKVKDSIGITEQQKQQLYEINISLHNQKSEAWNSYTNTDSLQVHIQSIENQRDAMYRAVLNEEQYQQYLLKKTSLINNN